MNERPDSGSSNRTIPTLLVVDDEPGNLSVLTVLLEPHYKVRVALSGADALQAAATLPCPALILLDVMMPRMGGYAVLGRLRENPATRDIPVIFVTAMDSNEDEQRGLELGAVDYITKPINPSIVLARIRTQLELKATRDHLAFQNVRLEMLVAERTRALKSALETAETANTALKKTYFGTLMAISALAELRGASIGDHSRRVADLSRQIARELAMDEAEVQEVFIAALLHDIGRISFSDELLKQPVSAMNAEQLALYRQHPGLAADALSRIDTLANIAAIVRYHHERYDGEGFPEGRSGLDIPLGARIIAAVSDYDDFRTGALTTSPMTAKESIRRLVEGRGHRYDPTVIDRLEPHLSFETKNEIDEIKVSTRYLSEGMVLTRDLKHPDGFLLLSTRTMLNRRHIDDLAEIEKNTGKKLDIHVLRETVDRS
ncbi:MAG: response regulator [Sulfuritalea sp.]|nr:response regulator [Sulfuritalea sp.]